MVRSLDILRSGAWLTRKRLQVWTALLLVAATGSLLYLFATAQGLNDAFGRPLGTDFSNVYAAGTYVLDGEPTRPFDPESQHARERQIFADATPFYGWHYPPFFLFVAAALAMLPYLPALSLFQGTTLLLYLATIRAILAWPLNPIRPAATDRGPSSSAPGADHALDPIWILVALAFPAVFVNLTHGQNGFLTAALIGAALVLLERRPALAGILFGLLAYKPQFGLLIPLVLAATGRWRAFAAAATVVTLVAGLATSVFGTPVWQAFLASADFNRVAVLEGGGIGWHKIQSVFSWVCLWGGAVWLAYLLQAAVTIAVAVTLIRLWRGPAAFALKAAGLACATLLATPYVLDYDLMVVAVTIAFFVRHGLAHGFRDHELTLLAAAWMMPLVARSFAETLAIPLGPIVLLAIYALILRRSAAPASADSLARA